MSTMVYSRSKDTNEEEDTLSLLCDIPHQQLLLTSSNSTSTDASAMMLQPDQELSENEASVAEAVDIASRVYNHFHSAKPSNTIYQKHAIKKRHSDFLHNSKGVGQASSSSATYSGAGHEATSSATCSGAGHEANFTNSNIGLYCSAYPEEKTDAECVDLIMTHFGNHHSNVKFSAFGSDNNTRLCEDYQGLVNVNKRFKKTENNPSSTSYYSFLSAAAAEKPLGNFMLPRPERQSNSGSFIEKVRELDLLLGSHVAPPSHGQNFTNVTSRTDDSSCMSQLNPKVIAEQVINQQDLSSNDMGNRRSTAYMLSSMKAHALKPNPIIVGTGCTDLPLITTRLDDTTNSKLLREKQAIYNNVNKVGMSNPLFTAANKQQLPTSKSAVADCLSTACMVASTSPMVSSMPNPIATGGGGNNLPSSITTTSLDITTAEGKEKKNVVTLTAPEDKDVLSMYQCLLREQIVVFETTDDDANQKYNGRRKNQVGIQCKYCMEVPSYLRGRASTFYPRTLPSIYQAAQNISCIHLCDTCTNIPYDIKYELKMLRDFRSKSATAGGKKYWIQAAKKIGLYEENEEGPRLFLKKRDASQQK